MSVCIKAEGQIEAPEAEIEMAEITGPLFGRHPCIKGIVEIDIKVVIFEKT
ncbi:hypothetical protein MASR1M12_13960 [Erysipelotrichia bacterium]